MFRWKWLIAVVVLCVCVMLFTNHRASEREKRLQQLQLSSVVFEDEPVQQRSSRDDFEYKGHRIVPLASFAIRARVLATEHYSLDAGAKLSPVDLALGWKRMADPAVYVPLNITQGSRWYRYTWQTQPPIPPAEIIESSANMHMIPANPAVQNVLEGASEGDYILIKGLLVEAHGANGWKWRSSLSRTDSGMGSCELIYVEAAEVEKPLQ